MHYVLAEKGGSMKLRVALLACAGLFASGSAFAQDSSLVADAKAFGARESVIEPRLSNPMTRSRLSLRRPTGPP